MSLATGRRAAWLLIASLLPTGTSAASLLQFFDAAVDGNPRFRSRQLAVEQAEAEKDVARSRLLPQLRADGSYDWNKYMPEVSAAERYTGVRATLTARQPLLDVSSYHRFRGAQSVVQQAEHELAAAGLELSTEVVDRYLAVLQADDELVYLKSEQAAIARQVERLRLMSRHKLAKITDLYEVEAYAQALVTRDIEVRNAQAIARERLRETTGMEAQSVQPLALQNPPAVPGSEEHWVRDALADNPYLQSLWKVTEAARSMVYSGQAEHLPRIFLSASRIHADQGYDNRQVPEYGVGTVGIAISLPIFEGGRVEATVRDATARYRISLQEYEAARREIERSVRSAYLDAVASHARIRSTNEETRALEKVLEAQTKSYEFRIATILDVLVAQRRLTKARSEESKAKYDYVRALTILKGYAGQSMRDHIEQIDAWMAPLARPPDG